MSDVHNRDRWVARISVGVAAVALLAGPVTGIALDFTAVSPEDPITASDYNARFDEVAAAVNALEDRQMGRYCGSSASDDGDRGGYEGVKAACVSACGVPRAHGCTGKELVLSAQEGIEISEAGYYSTGQTSYFPGGGAVNDCEGWDIVVTENTMTRGASWDPVNQSPNNVLCDTSLPMLCCS